MTAKEVYARIQECDKALRTLKGSGFEHMAQVKREEHGRWVHELDRQAKLGSKEATKFRSMVKTNRA